MVRQKQPRAIVENLLLGLREFDVFQIQRPAQHCKGGRAFFRLEDQSLDLNLPFVLPGTALGHAGIKNDLLISFHPEASRHVHRTIQLIKASGCQAGLVLNPATPVDVLDYVLDELDLVLLMSVNPGFGGQAFIPSALDKLKRVRERIERCGKPVRLEIDGGVKADNIGTIAAAGADTFVAGSAIFGAKDRREALGRMRAELARVE